MSSHHRILGVPTNATLSQIKKAYFKKAKQLHPDVNKSSNAMKDFMRLNMAYEALTNPGYIQPPIYTSRKKRRTKSPGEIKRDWVKKRNENLKQMAKEAVKKRKLQSLANSKTFYRSFTFNFICLFSGFVFLTPAIGSYLFLGDEDNSERYQEILIISLTTGITGLTMIGIFLRYLFLRLFK
jgi:hypothetical protein